MNKFAVYCGPCRVDDTARVLVDHVAALTKGTAHVYVVTRYGKDELVALLNRLGFTRTYRDVQQVSQ